MDQAIQDPAISNGDLRMKCKDMLNISQQLVKQTIKIINIGDLHQKKLYDANIEIEAQKKTILFSYQLWIRPPEFITAAISWIFCPKNLKKANVIIIN